ncbi:Frataxin [Metschnikowia bicuspidata var. bicuspidata NRRL YB-4993]|uniref:ferroxidase n=1 Tax=Metschnikowia bicuspidata var. bicuspidata NRRL YB-4993 TaxID=869754 RepID=A0A1A0H7R3_9ASCO|nr:Frataxin [Metschnikowia bicuspidata var. bicuspidata NRRL YB-4993]OBA19932.1 Frataxin [Metschnikowia bicuspidata var. bicuspidata NRRL YB-4993]
MFKSRPLALVASIIRQRAATLKSVSRLSRARVLLVRNSSHAVIVPRRGYVISTDGTNIENLIDQISDAQYSRIANEYLETLSEDMEDLCDEFPQIDVELTQGVMTLTVAEGKTYVINRQPPNKQIWLSSPYSGPKRYDLIGGRWITLRDNSSLTDLLQEELGAELGQEISLNVQL